MKKMLDLSNLTPAQLAFFNELQAQISAQESTIKKQNETLKKSEKKLENNEKQLRKNLIELKNTEKELKNTERILKKKDQLIKEKDAKILSQEKIIAEQLKKISELENVVSLKTVCIKRMNTERFFSKSDNVAIKKLKNTSIKETNKPVAKRGRKPGTKNFKNLDLESLSKDNEIITLDIAKDLLKDDPDLQLIKIGEDTTYLIKRIRAHIKVFKVNIPIYKDENNKLYRAENTLSPIPHSYIDASLLADSIAMKYFLGVPEYRYAKWTETEGFPFSQKTYNNWALRCAELLEPFYDNVKTLFSKKDLNIENIHIDETTLDVIENKKESREKSYVFCYSTDCLDKKITLFEYSKTRKTDSVKKILEGYDKIITVDGYSGYDAICEQGITRQACMVHARREFANITKTLSDEELKKSNAYKIVKLFDKLFKKEALFKKHKLTPEQIVHERNMSEYIKLTKDLDEKILKLEPIPGGELEKAKNYRVNLKDDKWTYLKNGRVELDNNEAERQAKKFVIDRKNFLFSKTERGAKASCILLTVLDLAYENGIDPRDYLEYVLNNVQELPFEQLLPWYEKIKETMSY